MAGEIHRAIESIIAQKAHGNSVIASSIRTKLILMGINVGHYDALSADDPEVLKKLKQVAEEFGVRI